MIKKTMRYLAPLALVLGLGALSSTAEAGPRDRDGRWDRFERGRRGPPPGKGYRRGPMRPGRFGRRLAAGPMDLDRDGFVTRPELRRFQLVEARATARHLDRNLDGWLSPRELRRASHRVAGYARADLDRDGWVNRAERRAVRRGLPARKLVRHELREANRRFRRLDRNRDGVLSRFEARRFASTFR